MRSYLRPGRLLATIARHYPRSRAKSRFKAVNTNKKELALATRLIKQLSTKFSPEKYKDEYRLRLSESIQKKITGEQIIMKPSESTSNVMDLLEALQASVDLYKEDEKPKSKVKAKAKPTSQKTTEGTSSAGKNKDQDNVEESAS